MKRLGEHRRAQLQDMAAEYGLTEIGMLAYIVSHWLEQNYDNFLENREQQLRLLKNLKEVAQPCR